MATEAADVDFVTIVPVGEGRPCAKDPAFVTVLTVGANTGAAEIIVRRPRGERLGLGLKFEGGSAAAEKVRRLLVQSCAENSPAANAQAPWGKLIPGDEILAIDGVSVSELTRIDCVRRLKDSDESLTLLVRHFEMDHKVEENGSDMTDAAVIPRQPSEIVRPTTLPPPVPPRKLGKKNSFKDKPTLQTVGEQNSSINDVQHLLNDKETLLNGKHNGISTITKLSRKSSFDSHILRQNKEGINYFKKGSPEEVRRLVRRLSDGKAMPAEAEVYIDLLSSEWERCLVLADAESDDTGSSISTVVDRLGSMTNSVENSIPSTPTMQPKTIDIQKVLNCIENIDTNILKDMTSKNFLEKQINLNNESKAIEKSSAMNIFNGHDTPNPLSLITDENGMTCKKIYQNDKNNNNALISSNTNGIDLIKRNKTDQVMEKPKPMPRNTKIERSASEKKPRTIPIPEISPPSIPDTLLTPTKKNCIETWLQRSEAEMNNKSVEKLEDNTVQEILPRLIDFVPKPQYKEGNSESQTLARPTTAPPPPPTETREDGSGASLDTIGELDETADVTTNVKPLVVIETKPDRKSTFERNFWEDRLNKSDAEDKSLSNDETPLPSCSRQPPDGVETPSDAIEKTPDLPSRLPPRLPTAWPTTRSRFSYSSRTQDARSEASVKDKIAMFSNDHAVSTDRIDKCGTLPTRTASSARKSAATYSSSYSDVSSLDRRLTKSQDNLDDMPKTFKRHTERPEVLGATETVTSSSVYGLSKINKPLQIKSKPLFYGSTTIIPSSPDTSFVQQVYHARSVSEDNSVSTKTNTTAHKSNLEYLIEQRKKSMSKLRGLVIPEVQGPIVDLPEIKVQDPLSKSFLLKTDLSRSNSKPSKPNDTKPMTLNDTKWKVNLLPNNIPKYSPAFKRKSLQVYTPSSLSKESTPERSFNERVEALNKLNNKTNATYASRASLDSNGRAITASFSSKTLNNTPALPKKDYKDILNHVRDCKNVEVKMCTATDVIDSDNDSAMSSTQSSYRSSASSPMHALDNVESDNSRLSPKITEYSTYSLVKTEVPSKRLITERSSEEYIKRNVCRSVSSDTNVSLSSSAGSAATSGSQASCSSLESSVADSDKRKVSKAYNIDTINRRNILASAKCRSGRDAKLKSPVVETKFSHESCDGSPSPVLKASERLSTLTAPVSAVSNKGENRRRNKIIAETDSDSDSDTNIRQRKPDYKNTRLKRNSSSTGKNNKQNESNLDSPKLEDAPKVISEKIIKEIKKAGLDDFTTNKAKPLSNKNLNDNIKTDKIEINKEEKNYKTDNSQIKNGRLEINSGKTTLPKGNNTLKSNRAIESPISNNKTDSSSAEDVQISTQVIRLKRGAGTGVGVILAGGIDCEAKDVTVHRVLADSVAAKAGLKRGVKVRSINGYTMTGLTHAQSVTILKEQRSEVVIEIENEIQQLASEAGCGSDKAESDDRYKHGYGTTQDKEKSASSVVSVILEKAGGGAGLGFGLDGGRDSPRGDCPLTIKKLFAGGAAAQSGRVLVGAELLSAGGQSMEGFTRTQAWAALKALPAGPVCLVLKNPKDSQTQ